MRSGGRQGRKVEGGQYYEIWWTPSVISTLDLGLK